MKIGFVFDDSLDKPDGVQQYILTLGTWLSSQGHVVYYLVGQTERSDLANTHSLSRNIAVRFNKNRLTIPLPVSSAKISRFLRDEQFDVLHVQMPYSPQLAQKVILSAPTQTAIVGTFHILPYGKLQAWGSAVLARMLSKSLARFDTVVAVSPAAQNFAKTAMSIDSQVLPNAVDLSRFATKPVHTKPHKTTNIVFLGRLVPRKGCAELLRALALLQTQEKLQGVSVSIGGNGQDAARLKAYVAAHNLTSVVAFKGQLEESDKAEFLGNADIVVLPSLGGESFGITVVEAIASGAGVTVGGNNPGYSFVLADTPEALVDPLDTTAFAATLDTLITDSKLRTSLGKKQLQRIKLFDVPTIGQQIESIYKRAVQKHGKV